MQSSRSPLGGRRGRSIDSQQLMTWVIQALISFLFGGGGAFIAYMFTLRLEKNKEAREQQERKRELLMGGPIPPSNVKAAVSIARGRYLDIDGEDASESGRH